MGPSAGIGSTPPQGLRPGGRRARLAAASYASSWKRPLPGWWSYRGQVAGLSIQGRPKTAALFGDMGELDVYRRREDYAREVRDRCASGLALNGSGQPDRQRTLEGIAEAKRL